MKGFFGDIWHDLREKRLWPVALVLALALVAVPVLLAKPAEEPESPTAAAPVVPDEQVKSELAVLEAVELAQEAPGTGSVLGLFDPSDPFRPPKAVVDQTEAEELVLDVTESVEAPESTTGGSDGGGGTETPAEDETPDSVEVEEEVTVTQYQYVVDLTFQSGERTKHVKGMQKLEMLPNEDAPLLIFMGVTTKGSNAVFLVDSTLKSAGEGRCKPSRADCAFVHIGPGSEQTFTDPDGMTYTLLIDEIRRVKVETKAEIDRKVEAGGTRSKASLGATGRRRFVPPLLPDLVVETGTEPASAETGASTDTDDGQE